MLYQLCNYDVLSVIVSKWLVISYKAVNFTGFIYLINVC